MATFTAAWDGPACGTCDVRIAEGDEVTYDGTDSLVHATCPEADLGKIGPICPRCFLELPLNGDCGNC